MGMDYIINIEVSQNKDASITYKQKIKRLSDIYTHKKKKMFVCKVELIHPFVI